MHDAVCEILDVDHRRLVRFLPTDQEDTWPDGRDRNLHGLIPICVLSVNPEVREKRHRTQALFVLSQLSECLTQYLDQLIQGGKDAIVQVFLAQFLPQMFDGIDALRLEAG